ncbi:MAG: hypothetical protein ACK4J0_02295 [Candidatus Anstonellaceae archaeon]
MGVRTKIVGQLIQPANANTVKLVKKTSYYENPFVKKIPSLGKKSSYSNFLLLNLYSLKYAIERAMVEAYINKDLDYLDQGLSSYKDNLFFYLHTNLDSSRFFSTSFAPLKKSPEGRYSSFSKLLSDFIKSSEGQNFLFKVKTLVFSHPLVEKLKNQKLPLGRKSIKELEEKNVFLTKQEPKVFIKKHILEFQDFVKFSLPNYVFYFFSMPPNIKVYISKSDGSIFSSLFKKNSYVDKKFLFETNFGYQGFKISKKRINSAIFFEIVDFQLHLPTLDF